MKLSHFKNNYLNLCNKIKNIILNYHTYKNKSKDKIVIKFILLSFSITLEYVKNKIKIIKLTRRLTLKKYTIR